MAKTRFLLRRIRKTSAHLPKALIDILMDKLLKAVKQTGIKEISMGVAQQRTQELHQ